MTQQLKKTNVARLFNFRKHRLIESFSRTSNFRYPDFWAIEPAAIEDKNDTVMIGGYDRMRFGVLAVNAVFSSYNSYHYA